MWNTLRSGKSPLFDTSISCEWDMFHKLRGNPRGIHKTWGVQNQNMGHAQWRVDWKLGGGSTSKWGQSWVNRLVNGKGYQTFVAEEVAFKNGDLKLQNWWYPKQILHKATRAWCGEVWQPFWWICHIMFEESLACKTSHAHVSKFNAQARWDINLIGELTTKNHHGLQLAPCFTVF